MREISDATEQRVRDKLRNKTKTDFPTEDDYYDYEIDVDELLNLLLQIHYLYPALCKRYRQVLVEQRYYQGRLMKKKKQNASLQSRILKKTVWYDGRVFEANQLTLFQS